MTAVIGILNKRGVAIAADSAVTRTRGPKRKKYTKNGNKLLRVSNCVPISIMITGNADFFSIPWDVIVRRYRQQRGDIRHTSVAECVHDFFGYISKNDIFWETKQIHRLIKYTLNNLIEDVKDRMPWEIGIRNNDNKIQKPKTYLKTFVSILTKLEKKWLKQGVCPQFEGYSIEQFHQYAHLVIDDFFEQKIKQFDMEDCDDESDVEIYNLISSIKGPIEHALLTRLTTRNTNNATLIFSGYGTEEKYPSLVAAKVSEGFDNKVNYHISPDDIVKIDEEHPVAICPFAQKDVAKAILRGIHRSYSADVLHHISDMYLDIFANGHCNTSATKDKNENDEIFDDEFYEALNQIEFDDLKKKFCNSVRRKLDSNQRVWEKALKDYDLQSMASLAGNLINLTGFHRILTFQQEGVGGPVDLAVISKTEGFTWLSRKSWYHHKDVNGQYGKFGV